MALKPAWRTPALEITRCLRRCGRRARSVTAVAVLTALLLCGCGDANPDDMVKDLAKPNADKAIKELARWREDVLPAVEEALRSSSSDTPEGANTIRGAIEVLVRIRDARSVALIGEQVVDPDARVRLAAIKALGQLGKLRKNLALERLEIAVNDEHPECVRAAADGLDRLERTDATAMLEGFLRDGRGIQAVFAAEVLYRLDKRPEAVGFVLQSLSASDEAVRTAAGQVAEQTGDKFVAPAVAHLLERPNDREVGAALGRIRDGLFEELDTGKLLAKRMEDVIAVLGHIADQQSAERLMSITATKEGWTSQVAAAAALGAAATSARPAGVRPEVRGAIIDCLTEVLQTRRTDDRTRISCAISLCLLQQKTGITYLLDKLEGLETRTEGNEESAESELFTELRIRAQEALTASGEFVVPFLIEKLDDPELGDVTAWAAMTTLGALRVEMAVGRVGRILTATTSPAGVEPRPDDAAGQFKFRQESAETSQAAERGGTPYAVAGVCALVAVAALYIVLRVRSRTGKLSRRGVLVAALAIAVFSVGIGMLYLRLARRAAILGAGESVFEPDRKAVLGHLVGGEGVVPMRAASVRMAAAMALGRIGGQEAVGLLEKGLSVHENLGAKLKAFVDERGFWSVIPPGLQRQEEEARRAREIIKKLAQRLLKEQQSVLFYIRRGLREAGHAPGGGAP